MDVAGQFLGRLIFALITAGLVAGLVYVRRKRPRAFDIATIIFLALVVVFLVVGFFFFS
jgi:hypothetical protein